MTKLKSIIEQAKKNEAERPIAKDFALYDKPGKEAAVAHIKESADYLAKVLSKQLKNAQTVVDVVVAARDLEGVIDEYKKLGARDTASEDEIYAYVASKIK